MRIAYLVSEYGLWGRRGGYGSITRALAQGMALRGHEVFALVPGRGTEAPRDRRPRLALEGVTVIALPPSPLARARARRLYHAPHADLFVGVDARLDSWLAMRATPRARHAIWLLDPMSFTAYWSQHREDPRRARRGEKTATRFAFEGLRVFGRAALRRADAVWSQRRELPEAARRALHFHGEARFAPNPVDLPDAPIEKSPRPLVLFLGRLDWQKQPERFFALARRFPDVAFVAAGAASDPGREARLRADARAVANLTLAGFVAGAEKDALLRRAWVLCNTSLREGLPHALQEGLAYGCALLARVDPDHVVSRFGAVASGDDFESILAGLLRQGEWRRRARGGRAWIESHHETKRALDGHEALYRELVA